MSETSDYTVERVRRIVEVLAAIKRWTHDTKPLEEELEHGKA